MDNASSSSPETEMDTRIMEPQHLALVDAGPWEKPAYVQSPTLSMAYRLTVSQASLSIGDGGKLSLADYFQPYDYENMDGGDQGNFIAFLSPT